MNVVSARWPLAAAAVLLLAACAQCGPMRDGDGSAGQGGRGGPGGPGRPGDRAGIPPAAMSSAPAARQWMVEQTAQHLSSVRQQLAITPAQSAAWDRYAASVGALVADLSRSWSSGAERAPAGSALQRVDRRLDTARNRYAALEDVADAMRALYAMLSDEQRATADRVLAATVPPLYDGVPLASMAGDMGPADVNRSAPARGGSRGEPRRMP